MAKKIVSVGMLLAADEVEHIEFVSKTSLLDWDIILFRPDITNLINFDPGRSSFQGKHLLGDRTSFILKEACAHWRREIDDAVKIGRTVIVHLCKPKEIFVQTGRTEYSGTGRNQKTTNIVEEFSNYKALPVVEKWNVTQGREVVVRPEYRDILGPYWERYGSSSTYEVTFVDADKRACLTTKHGNRTVGLHIGAAGNLLLLPDMDFDAEEFFDSVGEQDDDEYEPFTEAARQFASAYVAEIVALDRALRQGTQRTAEPSWAAAPDYLLTSERRLQAELLRAEEEVERAQKQKDELASQLVEAGQLRGLLFETGKQLEGVILKALHVLGFEAENFQNDENEFDAVFSSEEGRLLGEAEGKDNKAINITKLRQLTMNIDEDFGRDEVDVRAKGVLFGNAYRLTAPADRDAPFTDKCITSATAQSIALVPTPDLFRAVRHVLESGDAGFAKQCRMALVEGVGLVSFPAVPQAVEEQVEAVEG